MARGRSAVAAAAAFLCLPGTAAAEGDRYGIYLSPADGRWRVELNPEVDGAGGRKDGGAAADRPECVSGGEEAAPPPPPPPPPSTDTPRVDPSKDGSGGEEAALPPPPPTDTPRIDPPEGGSGGEEAAPPPPPPPPTYTPRVDPPVPDRPSAQTRGKRRRRRGRVTVDFGARSASLLPPPPPLPPASHGGVTASDPDRTPPHPRLTSDDGSGGAGTEIRMTADPAALSRLAPILLGGSVHLASAFVGTLRLLAPLIISRRAINFLGDLFCDYLRGRYFRKTYTRMERAYLRYYEFPAAFRALCRTSAQIGILFGLSSVMGWLAGVGHPPCRTEGRGLANACGVLWIGAVVGTGHACATAVALWGGPLRIQAHAHPPRNNASVKRVFTRPWHILQWMRNPEEWISTIGAKEVQPFLPNPIIFPMTWAPLRLLLICAVARVFATEPSTYRWCSPEIDPVPRLMKQFLVQLALGDEWYRVFLGERRVGLGIAVGFCHFIALLMTIITSVTISGVSALLMMPSLLAVIVSGWMNIVIFWNRLEERRKEAAINAFGEKKRAALNAFRTPLY